MKYKKGLITICLVICLFTIASVSAVDAADAAVQADNVTVDESISSEEIEIQDGAGAIASDEQDGQNELAISDENILSIEGHSFDELQHLIDDTPENDELNLSNDYSIAYGGDTLIITKNITINGNQHTLDGSNMRRILNIRAEHCEITFKNLTFTNGGNVDIFGIYIDPDGGAILNKFESNKLNIFDCEFDHNYALEYGGAINTRGPLNITGSTFRKNTVQFGNGGAVYCTNRVTINDSEFNGNEILKNINPFTKIFPEDIMVPLTGIASDGYYFYGEHIIKWEGLIKFMEKLASLFKNPLNDNGLPMTGGAVYCKGDCTVYNSKFTGNNVGSDDEQVATSGGAIHCQGDLHIYDTRFEDNEVNDWGGGAVFVEKNCYVHNSTFEDNKANKGCAIYCWGETRVYNSNFKANNHEEGTTWMEAYDLPKKIISWIDKIGLTKWINIPLPTITLFSSDGGAIWSQGECYIESCKFEGNSVCEQGGAIYAKSGLTITGDENTFHNNQVNGLPTRNFFEKDGGVIFCKGHLDMKNSWLYNNLAMEFGGAIYCEGTSEIRKCTLDNNQAVLSGGAIYCEKESNIYDCTFNKNEANIHGGSAVYRNTGNIHNCTFNENTVNLGGGGAVYFMGKTNAKSAVIDCEFNNNGAINGGAIRSCGGKLTISGKNKFKDNHASSDGGAIYTSNNDKDEKDKNVETPEGSLTISDCPFDNNNAGKKGGAIYSDNSLNFNNCNFGSNIAESGGAIYLNSENDLTYTMKNCSFNSNKAKDGGAIYAIILKKISNLTFKQNEATSGDGGAVYVHKHCNLEITSCAFEKNKCGKTGGAVHMDGYTGNLNVSHSTFNENTAGKDGGAIYTNYFGTSFTSTDVNDVNFTKNTAKNSGGAIYTSTISKISESNFIKNEATSGDGGAIYTNNHCNAEITSCAFENNKCGKTGGAVHMDGYTGDLKLYHSTFNENTAGKDGGAIYTNYFGTSHSSTEVNDVNFTKNTAKDGGAMYIAAITKVSNANFIQNKATSGAGGAVYIRCKCNPEFNGARFRENTCTDNGGAIYVETIYFHLRSFGCEFTKNHADKSGGAIHASGGVEKSEVGIKDSNFTSNTAKKDGGAVYASKVSEILRSSFRENIVNEGSGGAVFMDWNNNPNINSCTFEKNSAHNSGGAINSASKMDNIKVSDSTFIGNHADGYGGSIYTDCNLVMHSKLEVANCRFSENYAQQGGAIYTGNLKSVTQSAFIKNKATWGEGKTDGDGGAIYIYNKGSIDVISCRFENNNAYNRGGAIYIDSYDDSTKLKVSYSTFVKNNAENKKYKGKKGGGHSIYSNGYYSLLEMLWMGKNVPNFNGEFLEGHRTIFVKPADTPHTPSSWLTIELDINETNIHVNTPYKATIHFRANNGKTLQKELLHSNGYFNGDVNVTNLKADLNDITADVVFTKSQSTINGHVDDQTVSKTVQVSNLLTAINPGEDLLGEEEDEEFEPQIGPSDFNATIKDFIDLEDENDQVVVNYVVPQEADGKINVYVDYMDIPSYSKETVAGQSVNITTANLNIVNPDEYHIRIEYVPNSGDAFTIEELTMKAHIYTEQDFSISYLSWITSKNDNIVSHFSYPVSGTLVFYVNGTRRYTEEFEELHEHAYLHLSDLKIVEDGEYNISASYVIKTTLKEISFAQKTIEVDGVDWDANEYVTIFSYVDILDRKDYFIEIENNGDYINGTVSVYIDNTLKLKKSISPADKKVFYEITADDLGIYNNIALGNHTLKVIYIKDNNETHEVEKSVEFYAEPVFVDVFEISVGEKDVLKVTYLKGCKGTATLYNAMINQTEDSSHLMKGSVYKSANFVNGVATIPFDSMAEGEHIFILNITGYDHEASISVTVKRNSPEFSASVSASEVIVGNSVVVKFSGPQSGDFAIIILDDETYKIDSLENGTLSETITGLAVGTHRIKILYDNGTNFYSNTFYVTVKKVPTPAPQPAKKKVIKLTLKKVKVKKSAKKLVLKATLKINGKAVKGKKIIFKFKGKKYKAKTNKKGIAKVTIKKKVLKKLKVGKKIKYLAKYGKVTKKYTVKVKK